MFHLLPPIATSVTTTTYIYSSRPDDGYETAKSKFPLLSIPPVSLSRSCHHGLFLLFPSCDVRNDPNATVKVDGREDIPWTSHRSNSKTPPYLQHQIDIDAKSGE
ncbi:hypothetical protein L6452_06216 [Arctium lappa]|uniref:Uncharacterized protein n=1 Tax=Arctium lappa TaxID=4217 RepID=A0ACB9EHX6_ARCLA|nr:hypothetical protein L6452_06216 [Arctium lappa]